MTNANSILVIGASGFLGSEISRRLCQTTEVIATTYRTEIGTNGEYYDFFKSDLAPILKKHSIGTIIFAGAVETSAPENLIHDSMERVLETCRTTRFIYLSSDGIFSGETGNYLESDLPVPRNLYGRNLFTCEQLIKKLSHNYCIIRPSYIYGFSKGKLDSRLLNTYQSLSQSTEVKLFSDMFKSPLSVQQVAQGVIDLTLSDYIGVVHVAGKRMSIYDFHREAMLALGASVDALIPQEMPTDGDFLRDTSLDTSLWNKLTGTKASTIREGLVGENKMLQKTLKDRALLN